MDIDQIINRFASGLVSVDSSTSHKSSNSRTGEVYLPGVKTMSEPNFVKELVTWWLHSSPTDFSPANAIDREIPYKNIPRAKCDLILSSDGSPLSTPEWAIEVKHISLVGNNGKNNDFGVAKILSPYLKDRSLIHDIERLSNFGVGKHKAVIGYCFDYSFETCKEALGKHSEYTDYINNIMEVCKKNDPKQGMYSAVPMIKFADEIFLNRGLVHPVKIVEFKDAWRHPCGGSGVIFGWELR